MQEKDKTLDVNKVHQVAANWDRAGHFTKHASP